MAWATPRTWVATELVTAAYMNQDVRDNVSFLYNAPACRVYNSANISTTNAAYNVLTFNSERYDTDTMHSTSSNTSRITATTAGKYLISATVEWASAAGAVRELQIFLNGTNVIAVNNVTPLGGANTTRMSIQTVWNMAATDYVELRTYQDSGGALNVISTSAASPEFMATWLAA